MDLLAGGVIERRMSPLSSRELGFPHDISSFLSIGMLPSVRQISGLAVDLLEAYPGTYLREEIQQEALKQRTLPGFFISEIARPLLVFSTLKTFRCSSPEFAAITEAQSPQDSGQTPGVAGIAAFFRQNRSASPVFQAYNLSLLLEPHGEDQRVAACHLVVKVFCATMC